MVSFLSAMFFRFCEISHLMSECLRVKSAGVCCAAFATWLYTPDCRTKPVTAKIFHPHMCALSGFEIQTTTLKSFHLSQALI